MKKFSIFAVVSLIALVTLVMVGQLAARGEPLAKVDGQAITSEEIDKALGAQLSNLEEQIYKLKGQKVEELINATLLTKEARKRGISVPALLDADVTSIREKESALDILTMGYARSEIDKQQFERLKKDKGSRKILSRSNDAKT